MTCCYRTMRRREITVQHASIQAVKRLDAFPKIPEGYKETTASGGGSKDFLNRLIALNLSLHYYAPRYVWWGLYIGMSSDCACLCAAVRLCLHNMMSPSSPRACLLFVEGRLFTVWRVPVYGFA